MLPVANISRAGALITNSLSLVLRFRFGKSDPLKGEKARLNGSQGRFRSRRPDFLSSVVASGEPHAAF
jgi:hypothetical protein